MTTLDTLRENVIVLTQDDYTILQEGDYESLGEGAVGFYSRQRPYVKIYDISGDGSAFDWVLSGTSEIISDWIDNFSVIQRVEYPSGKDDERVLPELERDRWMVFKTETSTVKFRLLGDTPSTGETVRLTYTTPHLLDKTQSTIYQEDEKALENLWASLACKTISTHYAHQHDDELGADLTDSQKLSARFSDLSDQYKQVWDDHFPNPVVSLEKDLDISYSWGKTKYGTGDFMFHGKSRR